ncbi:hypothetical protein F4813DRAFT_160456 [Daldinia decipiens]|uniref:uncharacterized protein n=1 Tax=Daldinia decipiens TaxID=326647 RepID=UPI0020C3B011|nr:uncharacterized protein F4813DRAFT_160456 [Daldinia decipiens]KAI1655476.1 hypothetical protein F4813DRAFT_160456 [Daldinia decipiens]
MREHRRTRELMTSTSAGVMPNDLALPPPSQDLGYHQPQGLSFASSGSFSSLENFDFDTALSQAPQTGCPAEPPNILWDSSFQTLPNYPSLDSSIHISIHLITSQINSLNTRINELEVGYKKAMAIIEELTAWSKKMEKHCNEMNNTLLRLFGMVQKPEFLRGMLDEAYEPPPREKWA